MSKQNKKVEEAQGADTTNETNVPRETPQETADREAQEQDTQYKKATLKTATETTTTFGQLANAFIEDMVDTDEVKVKTRAKMGRSTIYLLKAFKEYINKLATYKVCTAEEITELRKIHKTATERWIGLEIE